MLSRCFIALLALALLIPTAVLAGPAPLDILSLHLGMRAASVMDRLASQGIASGMATLRQAPAHCEPADAAACPRRIEARTPDGLLVIRFAPIGGSARVARIDYAIIARGPADYDRVRQAALAHYGPPMQLDPLSWCDGPDPCPRGAALLTFRAASDVAARLALRARP
ncbi:MAG: hypothetical protein KGL12_12365 [Rhodospirillales bacterium]|nr:hypothetical protein [Rhodospirillales bacterium]